jgi:hypothetical protein
MTCSTIASDTYDVSLRTTYNGPLSARQGALVEYVGERQSSSFNLSVQLWRRRGLAET